MGDYLLFSKLGHKIIKIYSLTAANMQDLKKELELDVHRVPKEELFKRWGVSDPSRGLTKSQAEANYE